ncbi:hypothetical protein HanPSC8_Chr13g0564101 [Helianthus annuus]|nr:hypothetical protein HanPSC8_Chr13g0564101 [Helianthus annuus]
MSPFLHHHVITYKLRSYNIFFFTYMFAFDIFFIRLTLLYIVS